MGKRKALRRLDGVHRARYRLESATRDYERAVEQAFKPGLTLNELSEHLDDVLVAILPHVLRNDPDVKGNPEKEPEPASADPASGQEQERSSGDPADGGVK
jgi:hypothetical protein